MSKLNGRHLSRATRDLFTAAAVAGWIVVAVAAAAYLTGWTVPFMWVIGGYR